MKRFGERFRRPRGVFPVAEIEAADGGADMTAPIEDFFGKNVGFHIADVLEVLNKNDVDAELPEKG